MSWYQPWVARLTASPVWSLASVDWANPSGGTSGGGGGGGESAFTFTSDPTLLPASDVAGTGNGLAPSAGTYGRTLTHGQRYRDPQSGVSVLRVTDATFPNTNPHATNYPGGGPVWSVPFIKSIDSEWWTTLAYNDMGNGWRFVDIRYSDLSKTNDRAGPGGGELQFCFSSVTAQIGYWADFGNKVVHRYSTGSSANSDIGNWPWSIAASGNFPTWMQTQSGDTWVVCMLNDNHTVCAFRQGDNTELSMTVANSGVNIDEPHLDLAEEIVYMSCEPPNDGRPWLLSTNTMQSTWTNFATDGAQCSDDHSAPLRGGWVGCAGEDATIYGGGFFYRRSTDQFVRFRDGYTAYHTSGSEWYHNGYGNLHGFQSNFTAQWYVAEMENIGGDDDPSWSIRAGVIALVRPDTNSASAGGDIRYLCAHDSLQTSSTYSHHARAAMDQTGCLVAFNSNMSGTTRLDVFVAKVPFA